MKNEYKSQLKPGVEYSYVNDLLFEKTELLGEENGENLAVTSLNSKFIEDYLLENKLMLNYSENFEQKEKIVEMELWNIISELKKKMIDNFVFYSNIGKESYVVYDKQNDICEMNITNISLSQKIKKSTKEIYIYNKATFPKIEENKMVFIKDIELNKNIFKDLIEYTYKKNKNITREKIYKDLYKLNLEFYKEIGNKNLSKNEEFSEDKSSRKANLEAIRYTEDIYISLTTTKENLNKKDTTKKILKNIGVNDVLKKEILIKNKRVKNDR